MSRRKNKKVEADDKAEIDLTPMLDVVFIMLIFFIVTASFVKERSLGVNPPDKDSPPQTQDNSVSILIQVDANNQLFMEGRRVDIRSVRSLIAQRSAENPEAPIVVRAHNEADTETYVHIADAAREVNPSKVVSLINYKD